MPGDNVQVLRNGAATLGDALRKLAIRADLGEFQSAAVAAVTEDGRSVSSWWLSNPSQTLPVIGAVGVMGVELSHLHLTGRDICDAG